MPCTSRARLGTLPDTCYTAEEGTLSTSQRHTEAHRVSGAPSHHPRHTPPSTPSAGAAPLHLPFTPRQYHLNLHAHACAPKLAPAPAGTSTHPNLHPPAQARTQTCTCWHKHAPSKPAPTGTSTHPANLHPLAQARTHTLTSTPASTAPGSSAHSLTTMRWQGALTSAWSLRGTGARLAGRQT